MIDTSIIVASGDATRYPPPKHQANHVLLVLEYFMGDWEYNFYYAEPHDTTWFRYDRGYDRVYCVLNSKVKQWWLLAPPA